MDANNLPIASTEWFNPTPEQLAEVDIEQLRDLQALTPEQRLERHEGARKLVLELRKLGQEYYGFDPQSITQVATERTEPKQLKQ